MQHSIQIERGKNMRDGEVRDCLMCKKADVGNVLEKQGVYCTSQSVKTRDKFAIIGISYAEVCGEFEAITDYRKVNIALPEALKFMLAGTCAFTMVSGKTGVKLSYKLVKRKSNEEKGEYIYFMRVIRGTKDIYAGLLVYNKEEGEMKFIKGKKGQLYPNDVYVKSILYVINNLNRENYSMNIKIYHEGRCGRCGRRLTTPKSIMTGIGPECAKKVGSPW